MTIRASKNPTKEGNKYYFDVYYDIGNKKKRYRSKLYATKAEAKKEERIFLQARADELSIDDYTFNEIIESYIQYKKRNWKKSTLRANVDIFKHIQYKLGNVYVSKLTRAQYEAFLKYLDSLSRVVKINGRLVKNGYSARYKNNIVSHMKSICNYAEKHYSVRTKIPFLYEGWKEEKKTEMVVITPEQFEKFVANLTDIRYQSLYTFLFYTGCRRGERMALTFEDVVDGRVTINKSYSKIDNKSISTKTSSSVRTIPLSAKALLAVDSMREYHSKKRGFSPSWFIFGGKKQLPFTTIEHKKNKALSLAGLPYMRVHDFRHSFVTMAIDKGLDIAMISKYVGHASIKQTLDTYTHFYEDKLESLINAL